MKSLPYLVFSNLPKSEQMIFPNYHQHDARDCGPTCLRIIAKYHGKEVGIEAIREWANNSILGSSLKGLMTAAERMKLKAKSIFADLGHIEQNVKLPCIVHWEGRHFIVVYKIKKNRVYVSDPAKGKVVYTKDEFLKGFYTSSQKSGYALLLEPTSAFRNYQPTTITNTLGFGFLWQYVKHYSSSFTQIIWGLIAVTILNLLLPFLTQAIVDVGIKNHNSNFITLVLIAQLVLFASRTGIDMVRSWILMHVSKRINVSLLADYFRKLMYLPISKYDGRVIGDFLQRIGDHERVEKLLTSTSLNSLFSFFTLLAFSVVLGYYSTTILVLFLSFSLVYVLWVLFFLKKRREVDQRNFSQQSENQSKVIELLVGMKEIKLNNAENKKRGEWEEVQSRLFQTGIKGLTISQWQQGGSQFINELKNIGITFYAAHLVLEGSLTLGMMLAISYIIGQLNNPIRSIIDLITSGQDAKISLERLGEIHNNKNEQKKDVNLFQPTPNEIENITIENASFRYNSTLPNYVFRNLNLTIPAGKTTAIVGTSGSGKTTLLKLLLKFYYPEEGSISLSEKAFNNIDAESWRRRCGVVLQEGMLFSDSIANNIALSAEETDHERLLYAAKIANIHEFIEQLPSGYETPIGRGGLEMSTGQKQRVLIARAVYKNPDYLFFDEATSALDANNEQTIMQRLQAFYKGRTVVVVAHRLSTVKDADQIVVLHKGDIIEQGNHQELVALKGAYYTLIKNQLELGS